MTLQLTIHAKQRMDQRGFSDEDIWFLEMFGTETDDGIVFTRRNLVGLCERANRLVDAFVPVAKGCAITIQRLSRRKSKRVRRR